MVSELRLERFFCVRAKKNKRVFFFSREAYTRIIVIDLIMVKLFGVCPCGFSFQRERVFHVNICVLVCDCYFELLIFMIILFGTQQVVSKLRLEWKQWQEKKARV